MTAVALHPILSSTRAVARGRSRQPLLLVVGYDASVSSRRALDAAASLIQGRPGHLSVVFVAADGGAASMSPGAALGRRMALDERTVELAAEVRTILADREPRWDFRRLHGPVADGLIAAADYLRVTHGPASGVFVVVGSSTRHHHFGSVPVALARDRRYPILVYPATDRMVPQRGRRTPPSEAPRPAADLDAES